MTWPVDPARYLAFPGAMAILAATPELSNQRGFGLAVAAGLIVSRL